MTAREEVIPEKAELLLAEKLTPIQEHPSLYPPEADVKTILSGDKNNWDGARTVEEQQRASEIMRAEFAKQAELFGWTLPPLPEPGLAVRMKESTLHYLPYDFRQSGFEKKFIENCLMLADFKNKNLEIYYNGERGLTGFVIQCFKKKNGFWKRLGGYTPDFLILQRKGKKPHKVLIVETKGEGFAQAFESRKQFMESDFLRINKEQFGYERFDFLFLRDDEPIENTIWKLSEKIKEFFNP